MNVTQQATEEEAATEMKQAEVEEKIVDKAKFKKNQARAGEVVAETMEGETEVKLQVAEEDVGADATTADADAVVVNGKKVFANLVLSEIVEEAERGTADGEWAGRNLKVGGGDDGAAVAVAPSAVEAAANSATSHRAVDDANAESQKAKLRGEKEERSNEERSKEERSKEERSKGGGERSKEERSKGGGGGGDGDDGDDSAARIYAANAAAVTDNANKVTVAGDTDAASPIEGVRATESKGKGEGDGNGDGNDDGDGGYGGAVEVSANTATPLPEPEAEDAVKVGKEDKKAKVEEMKLEEATATTTTRSRAAEEAVQGKIDVAEQGEELADKKEEEKVVTEKKEEVGACCSIRIPSCYIVILIPSSFAPRFSPLIIRAVLCDVHHAI
jgi:hypothetical protein